MTRDKTCLYCDDPAVVKFEAVADPDDFRYSDFVCAYHWRYIQLCDRHASGLILLNAKALDGRQCTKPFKSFPKRCPNDIWPMEKRH